MRLRPHHLNGKELARLLEMRPYGFVAALWSWGADGPYSIVGMDTSETVLRERITNDRGATMAKQCVYKPVTQVLEEVGVVVA